MDKSQAIDLVRSSLWFAIMISAPSLFLSVVVGLFISILQTTTQIHEQTLTFVPKILALLAATILFGPWMIESVSDFIWNLWGTLPDIAPH